jgi:hypothetical protein
VSRFRFIDAEKTNHPVRMMCRLLNVSSSGFYDWLGRGPSAREVSNMALTATIRAIHRDSNDVYGSPRVHAELVAVHGMAVSPKRVAALMAAADLVGVHRRKRRALTKQDKLAPPAPDLVGRKFTAVMPGIKMVGDITCLPTRQGWLYLASVIDLCTRKLVGYAMAHARTNFWHPQQRFPLRRPAWGGARSSALRATLDACRFWHQAGLVARYRSLPWAGGGDRRSLKDTLSRPRSTRW